ncbi:lysozyme inhibitor LprI family protein [Flavobacterium dauae]|uniref:lysozyme inhibitor LprI family protein n=1 Tax=Flavobacterium dauae TaxID=1563479 RepID=UPI00101B2F4F|nr:lysozyme inhibitor LprI family protein [Flavobacterium dauae]WLD24047.1 lysozyme inhibitor LprI family protein [Flavobacterium dauae]
MKKLFTIIMIVFSVMIYGQANNIHQIDKELEDCLNLEENYRTKGMLDCINSATTKWDVELNKTYKKLLSLLTVEQKEKLKIAQRKWIEYRDKEIEFSIQTYSDMQGTMWIPVSAQTKMDLTRQRTIDLENYIVNLTIGN